MRIKAVTRIKERTGRIGQRRQVVIPREILEKLQMREGDLVAFFHTANGLLLKPHKFASKVDVLTPEEAKLVRLGEALGT